MSRQSDVSRFNSVDQQSDPEYFIRFVERVNRIPLILELQDQATLKLRLAAGDAVLDLGCGMGEATCRLASVVGPTGEAVGVDASEHMVAVARQRAEGLGVSVRFDVGDARQLALPAESFDAVRCERLLVHVPDAAVVLAEMVRVTRPGGRVVVIDLDVEMWAFDLPDLDRAVLRRATSGMSDAMSSGRIGRQLPRLFREAKLHDVEHQGWVVPFPYDFLATAVSGSLTGAVTAGYVSTDDAEAVIAAIDRAERNGGVYGGMAFFVTSGTKP
jgi:ubiquinone/menaquinone biosynthesis C-methylase UbiE